MSIINPGDPGKTFWRENYYLSSYHIDIQGRTFITSLFQFMLNSAWAHANQSDFSYDELKKEGNFWVLSRFYAEFDAMPVWNDVITLETWGKGVDRLFAVRDFEMFLPTGKQFARASSAWLILDRQTLKPQRPQGLNQHSQFSTKREAVACRFDKVPEYAESVKVGEFIVRYSDIDLNRHVGSAAYLRWVVDCFPNQITLEKRIKSFEINYLAEGHLGDRIAIYLAEDNDRFICSVVREQEAQVLCRLILHWV
ncbi:MAG: thioesterase [Ignavibacteria bacterium]|nr:thioesterase [Ignavibacteria bacterium]